MPPRCRMLQRNSRRRPLLHEVHTYTCTPTFTISCFPSSKIGHSSERQALFWECEAKQNKTVELEVLLKASGKEGCRRRIASSNTHSSQICFSDFSNYSHLPFWNLFCKVEDQFICWASHQPTPSYKAKELQHERLALQIQVHRSTPHVR